MIRFFCFAAITALYMGGVASTAWGQGEEQPEKLLRAFMEAKLQHSQDVLKGLATENFDLIAANSQKMSLLSLAEQWQIYQAPEYIQRSTDFRRAVDALTNAAREKNLDGATLAYVTVTLNCVECHKYVRSVRAARLPDTLIPATLPR